MVLPCRRTGSTFMRRQFTLAPQPRQAEREEKVMSDVSVRRCAPLLALLSLVACGPATEEAKPASEITPPAAETTPAPKAHASIPASFKRTATGGVRDTGDFVVQYEETGNESYQEMEAIFKETRLLE